jgi:hypothetical protein
LTYNSCSYPQCIVQIGEVNSHTATAHFVGAEANRSDLLTWIPIRCPQLHTAAPTTVCKDKHDWGARNVH